jgi:hypothetical protein
MENRNEKWESKIIQILRENHNQALIVVIYLILMWKKSMQSSTYPRFVDCIEINTNLSMFKSIVACKMIYV